MSAPTMSPSGPGPATVLVRPREAARHLQIGASTVYRWIQEGRLPGVRLGALVRVYTAAVYGRGLALPRKASATVAEVAAWCDVSVTTVYRWLAQGVVSRAAPGRVALASLRRRLKALVAADCVFDCTPWLQEEPGHGL